MSAARRRSGAWPEPAGQGRRAAARGVAVALDASRVEALPHERALRASGVRRALRPDPSSRWVGSGVVSTSRARRGVGRAPPRPRARRRPGTRAASWTPGDWRPGRRCRRPRRGVQARARRCAPRCRCGCRPCSSARRAPPAADRAPGRGRSAQTLGDGAEVRVDVGGVEVAQARGRRAGRRSSRCSARATTSRGSSGSTTSRLVGVDEAGAFAAQGFGQEKGGRAVERPAPSGGTGRTRGRRASRRPLGERQAAAAGFGRVGRARPQRRVAAGGEDDRAARS